MAEKQWSTFHPPVKWRCQAAVAWRHYLFHSTLLRCGEDWMWVLWKHVKISDWMCECMSESCNKKLLEVNLLANSWRNLLLFVLRHPFFFDSQKEVNIYQTDSKRAVWLTFNLSWGYSNLVICPALGLAGELQQVFLFFTDRWNLAPTLDKRRSRGNVENSKTVLRSSTVLSVEP